LSQEISVLSTLTCNSISLRATALIFLSADAPGGIILFDDYGFTTCPGPKRAIDEFMAGKPEPLIWLSGGSAFLVKSAARK
jgi:hypothetical protein